MGVRSLNIGSKSKKIQEANQIFHIHDMLAFKYNIAAYYTEDVFKT